jgi:thiol-disulfide isomerase/thioredoxin
MISIGDQVRILCLAATAGLAITAMQPANADSPRKPSTKSSTAAASPASKTGTKPTVMDFGAAWCVPCKEFAPTFAKVKAQYQAKANFVSIDAATPTGEATAEKFSVAEFPTLVITDPKGKVVFRSHGKVDEKMLVTEVTKVVGK